MYAFAEYNVLFPSFRDVNKLAFPA